MLVYVYGPDTYRRGKYVRTQLLEPYQKKYPSSGIGIFDLVDADATQHLREFAGASGLFAKVSLAVVYHPEEGAKDFVGLLKSLTEATTSTIVVVAEKKLTKEFAFLANGKEKEFLPLTGLPFLAFLKAEAVERGLTVGDAKIKEIGLAYDGDLWGAITELQRVAFGGVVAEQARAFDFIGLIRTMTGGSRIDQKLKALALLLEYDDAAKVFNMAAAFAGGAGKVKMADYDVAIKSGKLEYAEALLEYALQ